MCLVFEYIVNNYLNLQNENKRDFYHLNVCLFSSRLTINSIVKGGMRRTQRKIIIILFYRIRIMVLLHAFFLPHANWASKRVREKFFFLFSSFQKKCLLLF